MGRKRGTGHTLRPKAPQEKKPRSAAIRLMVNPEATPEQKARAERAFVQGQMKIEKRKRVAAREKFLRETEGKRR